MADLADPTDEQLELLMELQVTDHALRKARHRLDELPEQRDLEMAEARVQQLGEELAATADRLAATERDAETLDGDITTLTQRRDAERARLYDGTVTNQREMSSVEAEIESTDTRIREHEEDLLVVLERLEELETRRDALTEQQAQAEQDVAAATTARDAAAKELLAEIAELETVRERQAVGLPGELRERYDQAAARGGGTGVGRLEQGACSACRLDFSMVELDELYKGPPLASCPQCRRLLVVGRG